jgi:hypothetical protein
MKNNPENPGSSPKKSSSVVEENTKKILLGDQMDMKQVASTFAGIASTTVISIPASSPILNILNRMHYLSKDHPWIKYPDVVRDIYGKEGIKGFYEQSYHNAKRRISGLGFGFCVSEALGKKYELDDFGKSSIAAISEAAVSLMFGEIKERRKTARAMNIPPQYVGAITSLIFRNMMFASSVYSDKIVNHFMENAGDNIAEQTGFSQNTVRAFASLSTKVALLSSTMPLDKAATKFSIGHNPITEYLANPTMAFKGSFARITYALIVGETVSHGIKSGKFIHEKLSDGKSQSRS